MAKITGENSYSIFQIKRWLGLNESPAGDTALKMGEASAMRNFRITREGHLQIRPGYSAVCILQDGEPVQGIWCGYVDNEFHLLAACGGQVWDIDIDTWNAESIGDIDEGKVFFFGFAGNVYMLTGNEYYCWDGSGPVSVVNGYTPIVVTASPPEGGGTSLERINTLTGKRRGQYSPDGKSTVFHLPERDINEVLYVDGTDISWVADIESGTITFSSPPPEGVNTLTFTWRKGAGDRHRVTSMKFAEVYNGDTDSRVFFYGDGTNKSVYSDLDENGIPSAEYFPEMNVVDVDSANTPVTAMIRHYDRLMVYKQDGAFCLQARTISAEGGSVTAGFTCIPVNREIGNDAIGQARLIRNNPVTLHNKGIYQWSLSSAGSRDERNAKRISQRIEETLDSFDLRNCVTFDDEAEQELYIISDSHAIVYGYESDAWYYYTGLGALNMIRAQNHLLFGSLDGRIMRFSRDYHSDFGRDIDAYWESGAMDLGSEWRVKHISNVWVAAKPESRGRIMVTLESERKSDYPVNEVSYSFSTFANASFSHWSFSTSRKPKVIRVKAKVKKFTFCKLILFSKSATSTATVLGANFQIRYTGNVK